MTPLDSRPLLIESLIRRPGGTTVALDGEVYHFKPSPTDKRHLCEVCDIDHARHLLAAPEGFRLAADVAKPAGSAAARMRRMRERRRTGAVYVRCELPGPFVDALIHGRLLPADQRRDHDAVADAVRRAVQVAGDFRAA